MSTNMDCQETVTAKCPEVTLEELEATVRHEVEQYLSSNPGWDSLASNGDHYLMRQILAAKRDFTKKELKRAYRVARYRLKTTDTATEYLQITKVPFPYGQTCREFDDRSVSGPRFRRGETGPNGIEVIWQAICDADVFPDPLPWQGQQSWLAKPMHYLKAAFVLADMSQAEIVAKLEKMKDIRNGRGIPSNL